MLLLSFIPSLLIPPITQGYRRNAVMAQQSYSTSSSASASASTTTARTRSSKKSTEDMSSSAPLAGNNDRKNQSSVPPPNGIFTIKPVVDVQETNESISSASSENPDLGPICDWADLPHWMQDNPAIWTGYRRPTFSYRKCLASLGFLHNESGKFVFQKEIIEGSTAYLTNDTSVNIYSHLLGALVCIIGSPIAYFKIFGVLDTIKWTDITVFYIFMAGAIICLSFSASFHCFSCHSEPVSCISSAVDLQTLSPFEG